jgi:hypothetical protein
MNRWRREVVERLERFTDAERVSRRLKPSRENPRERGCQTVVAAFRYPPCKGVPTPLPRQAP